MGSSSSQTVLGLRTLLHSQNIEYYKHVWIVLVFVQLKLGICKIPHIKTENLNNILKNKPVNISINILVFLFYKTKKKRRVGLTSLVCKSRRLTLLTLVCLQPQWPSGTAREPWGWVVMHISHPGFLVTMGLLQFWFLYFSHLLTLLYSKLLLFWIWCLP